MNTAAKLIHKTDVTYLPTSFPAHFYGMPDGKIYLVFSRFFKEKFRRTSVEFIFAEHKEFFYDYENNKVYQNTTDRTIPVFVELLDKPNPEVNIIRVDRDLNSYGEAFLFLNKQAMKMQVPQVVELQAS